MEKTAFYLDDYTLIKAYFYKPFDASAVNEIKILKNPAGNWSLDGEFAEGADGAEIKNIKSAITLVC